MSLGLLPIRGAVSLSGCPSAPRLRPACPGALSPGDWIGLL